MSMINKIAGLQMAKSSSHMFKSYMGENMTVRTVGTYKNLGILDDCSNFGPMQTFPPLNKLGLVLFSFGQKRLYVDFSKNIPEDPSKPQPPASPDLRELEKCLFRTMVIFWDIMVWLYGYIKYGFSKYVLANPTVKTYTRKFMDKIEKAKKD